MLHRPRLRIAVLPIFAPDGHGRARTFFGQKQSSFSGAVAAANDERLFAHISIRIDEAMMDFGKIFAGDVQMTWILHRANGEQNVARAIGALFVTTWKCQDTRPNRELVISLAHDVGYFLGCVNAQVVIKHEMNVVGKEFFTSRFFTNRMQQTIAHLQLVGRRKHCAADGILPDRISNRSFLDHQIRQAFGRCCVGRRQARRSRADD
jgi:hypothetical protein